MKFDFVPLHVVAHEIAPNVARHHTEMTQSDEYGTPNIDWDTYLAASAIGQCMVVTARVWNKLVGYCVFVISPNLRHKHILEASCSGLFIEQEYRGDGSLEFMSKCDEFIDAYMADKGPHEITYTLSDDRVGKLLERQGYKSRYKVWSRYNG